MEIKSTTFEFTSYVFKPAQKRIFLNYKVSFSPDNFITFTDTVSLPKIPNLKNIPKDLCKKILQDLHIALGVSYYKLYCSKKIKVNYVFTKEEADFWNSFYSKGLGEFFYKNKLNPTIFPKFKFDKNKQAKNYRVSKTSKFLIGISGGKDSILAVELFKKYGLDFSTIFMENQKSSPLVDNVIKITESKSLKIRRYLDKKIFQEGIGYYSGHVPISGIYAFLGTMSAVFYGYSYFVVANEFSSNFGNLKYKGKTINHQWSKSSEFEDLFQNYIRKFVSPDVLYFSLLRPFYEIRIAEKFAQMPEIEKYLFSFSSCNNNFKIKYLDESLPENLSTDPSTMSSGQNSSGQREIWCGKCPKCIFAFLILSPFLPKEKLISIFGKNLFENSDILITLRDILGFGKSKPFDCVGTYQEARAAFYMSKDKFRDDLAGEIFLPKIDPEDNRYFVDYKQRPIKIYFTGQSKPLELIKEVFKTHESAVPDYIKFLGSNKAIILGYGKEGKITKEYLKKNFSGLEIGIGDAEDGATYLEKQKDYDIAVRSPGVTKEKLRIPYTTATNMFFSYVRQLPGIKIIGITGTKGKSTTASLIHHILKKAGKRVELLGNIGTPMMSAMTEKIKKNTIFVLELSSYQLDDIKFSPDVAVVTSFFPEHMDYHGNINNYYEAKKNIIKYQEPGDYFVFNPKNKKIAAWAKETKAKPKLFIEDKFFNNVKLPLLGEHNKDNIRAAAAVARCFDVADNKIKKAIESFKGLPHRLEFIGNFKGIKFYDDAISTTPESTIMALKSLQKVDTIFLGGQDRGYEFSELRKAIKKYGVKNVVLFPKTGEKIIKSKKGLSVLETKSMEDAVKFSYEKTQKGGVCLLSCASPSYSLWKNFEEKGDQFKFWVKNFSK